jgi:hypothetical protein
MDEAHSGQSEAAEEEKGASPKVHLAEISHDWKSRIWCLKSQRNLKIS